MRILLSTLNASYVHSSLALRYLEAMARAAGHETYRREYTVNDRIESVEAEIGRIAPDLLAFSCYIWNIEEVLTICDDLKKVRPDLRILLGGPEVSHDPAELLAANPAVDFIICGEGEEPWSALLSVLPGGPYAGVPGLCWRRDGGIELNTPARGLPLERLPAPYATGRDELSGRLAYYESMRGCPYACSFCLSGDEAAPRFIDPARALVELADLARCEPKAVKFVDRTFNCCREHAMAVWRGLLALRCRTRFHFEIRADLLTGEELAFLATVPPGLFQFEIGVQSTNPETLAAIGRRTDLDRLAANVRRLVAAGNIHLHLDFIAGLPYEGGERFLESLDFGFGLGPHRIQVGFLKLLRGSRIRREADSMGYLYRRRPPYEVLANPWLSFTELNRLRIVADLVETYYNEGRFAHALGRLFAAVPSPARLFADFAAFCAERGWHLRPHQPKVLAAHLLDFAKSRDMGGPVFRDRLRLDLHRIARAETDPEWADAPVVPDLQTRWHAWLRVPENRALLGPEFAEMGPREAIKRAKVLAFRHDPTAPPAKAEPEPALVAVVHPEKGAGGWARGLKVDM